MVYGIDFDRKLTIELEERGEYRRGLLLHWGGSLWIVIGYNSYGWVDDDGLNYTDYEIILMHIKSGFYGDFPYRKVKDEAKRLKV